MSDTPETQEAVERWRQGKINIFDEMARLERERDEAREAFVIATSNCAGAQQNLRAAILERERWKMQAEQKWAMRRELEELLGVESAPACDEQFAKGINALRDLIQERDALQKALALIAEDSEAWLRSESDEPSGEFIKLVAKYAREHSSSLSKVLT